jgi:hypothetical protein
LNDRWLLFFPHLLGLFHKFFHGGLHGLREALERLRRRKVMGLKLN